MSVIQQLKDENERLRNENLEIKEDISKVANTFKTAWDSLGLDFSKMGNGKKVNMMDIVKISTSVGRKMMSGEIKIQELYNKWESVSPIIEKHKHVIENTPEENGN